MKKKITRRSLIKNILRFGFIVIMSSIGIHYYAREVETRLLQINHHTIKHVKIPIGFNGLKIVQFSDTHLGFHYDMEQFSHLVQRINRLMPDIIIFTGDLMDKPNQFDQREYLINALEKLKAPLGKFCIFGNHDHGGYGSEIYQQIMTEANFTVLKNDSRQVKLIDGSMMTIVGIDDAMLGKPDFNKAMSGVSENHFKILLSHAPELAKKAFLYRIHLQLSGHSHGGQIKIPFLGALVTPPFAEAYIDGFYQLKNSVHSLTLYVNRGVGTTRLPFRFLSRPEITVFKLLSLKKEEN